MNDDIRLHYQPKTTPFAHQWACLLATYRKRYFAILMDPGLGKTKVILDTAAILYPAGHISGMLVLAPNDVHSQWIEEQLPLHWPDHLPVRTAIWNADSKRSQRECLNLITTTSSAFAILAMNHEALATKRGAGLAKRFLQRFACLFVLDESHEYKTPSAARTRTALRLADLAPVRRILTGTLTGGTPFDLYSQFRFLHPQILNTDSFLDFKHRYATWTKEKTLCKPDRHNVRKLVEYEALASYQNLDDLARRIEPYTFTTRKEDCTDLPPKMYVTVPTHLSAAQLALYQHLADDGLALLARAEAGEPITIRDIEALTDDELAEALASASSRMTYKIKLTLMLRLQQCAAGFAKDDAGNTYLIDGHHSKCPRMTATLRYAEHALTGKGKVILWAHYRPALVTLQQAALERGLPSVLVYGDVKGQARADAIAQFKDPQSPTRVLIAHPRTLGTGQNFEVASTVLYYTRSFSYIQRRQSEDRAHRLSSTGTVTIGDVVAHNAPTDARELTLLREKRDFAQTLESFDYHKLKELLKC